MDTSLEMVGIGEFKISDSGVLEVPALGSCIAVALFSKYDHNKYSTLGHVFLPYSKGREDHGSKYADTGIKNMIAELLKNGIKKHEIIAKISGGANMFGTIADSGLEAVGTLNGKAVKEVLSQHSISLVGEDLGGFRGRKILFDSTSRELQIFFVKSDEKLIL